MGYAIGAGEGGAVWMPREVDDQPYAPRSERPDPADDDAIEDLGDQIATLAAHIHAATHRFFALIAEFDRVRGWERSGHASCADWLAVRCGIDRGTAREKVRTARALARLPLTSAAMAKGELSLCQARSLTRRATPDNEAELLVFARGSTVHQLERTLRAWEKGTRRDEAERERERYSSRTLSIFPDDDGMYVLKGRVMPEVGALLMRVIEAASDALFRESPEVGESDEERRRRVAQRRADALELVALRALAAGFETSDLSTPASESPVATSEPPFMGSELLLTASELPLSGSRAERYQVMLHVDQQSLSAAGEPGRSELEDGTRASCEASRRVACDASLVEVTHATDGSVLDVGRRARTIPPALRRALEVRDRGCRFPGCGRRFTDAHHVRHWADGGETSLGNCLLLCRHHHRLVHEGAWRIEWWGSGRPAFVDPRGRTHFEGGWQPPGLTGDPIASLIEGNERAGATPDGWTACVRPRR